MFELTLIPLAFLAGILMFLAPCTFPLVPGYLSFISGTSLEDLKNPEKAPKAKRKIFLNGVFFMIGFSAVFVVLGTLAGYLGQALVPYRLWLGRIGGALVIIFGLFMMNVLKIPFLAREVKFKPPAFFERGRPLNSLVLGSAFASGWTPCVGPILGSVLLLASDSATALTGALLLSVFSLGMAVPFLAVAAAVGSASRYVAKISRYLDIISFIGGLFLIFIGYLLITNQTVLLISYGYQFFKFINYDALLDYL